MANLTHFLEFIMRKRYVVLNNGHEEGFTKPAIDAMRRLDLIEFRSSVRLNSGTIYRYTAKDKRFK